MMNFKSLVLTTSISITGIVASGSVAPAQAFTTYFGQDLGSITTGIRTNSVAKEAEFLARLTTIGTENFEGFTTGATGVNATFGATGITGNMVSTTGAVGSGSSSVGRFPVSSTQYYEVGSGTFTINFNTAVAAFGFYGTDLGDFDGQLTLGLSNGSTLTVPHTFGPNPLGAPNGSLLYYGLIADNAGETFTSMTFGNTQPGVDFFGFDDLTVGTLAQVVPPTGSTDVPEPFTIIGTLVGGSAALRMRNNLKSSTKA
ncbi:hypothetical protein [Chamaesiphon sp. VAR_48_metabat_135_sub]|uniref:hypothetical protein n=1 Tax=Chamaesiphon sp. VAR_48_metabat_135_sub TaxID=2964699 RepID=UPI00286B829E|nr:hypothetical protein [Chamaesiphon sp. VAR_48_metabat_135_sub]